MRKKITISAALSIMFIAITVTFCLTMILSARIFEDKVSNVNEKETMYSKISEVDQTVRQHYYTDIDDTALVDGMSSGYIASLGDSEAKYYTASEVTALQNISKGKLIGIGIEVQKDVSGYYKIVNVDTDSPADIAEMAKDDLITQINDVSVMTMNTKQVRELLTGTEGTAIKLDYLRNSEENVTELVFAIYDAPSIKYSLENNVGYIKIASFVEDSASEVEYAIKNLLSQGATSFAIDIRFNSSKEYNYAAEVADIFAKEGTTMYAQYADDSQKVLYTSDKEMVQQPVTVIVNGQTGYAAEMFAVILKDMNGAKLVGTKTMGKCTIQNLYRLSDGSGVEITTARLVPVSSAEYHGTGILPDYEKALSADQELNFYDLTIASDPQIQRAIEVANNMVSQNG
ncbi:MAG: PDZ domain-containing protein [Oscillospiraceae bacterium]|nr:PDZ domain-containing protein [Oscillospiraceae bacterium]